MEETNGTIEVEAKPNDYHILYYPNEKSGGNIVPENKKLNWKKIKVILDRED